MSSSQASLLTADSEPEDEEHNDVRVESGASPPRTSAASNPFHKLRHDKSILALAIASDTVFAGTEGGEILVYSLEAYKRIAVIQGHRGGILSLCLSQDESLLFSGATDRFVNVWNTKTLRHVYSIYSTYDVGDIFCVSFSSILQTVYLGAQNTSIQWYDLKERDSRPKPTPTSHPYHREDRFFDSAGPTGARTPRSEHHSNAPADARGGQDLEIDRRNVKQFAHFGYVYCMQLAKGLTIGDSQHPYPELLVTGGGDGIIKIWNLDQSSGGAIEELHQLDDGREEGDSILSLIIDGTFLYSGRIQGEINIWDLETFQLVRSFKAKTGDVLTLSTDSKHLFAGGGNGYVEEFSSQHERKARFIAHRGRILASAFTKGPSRKSFYVTAGNDNAISFWDVNDSSAAASTWDKTNNAKLVQSLQQFVSYRTVSSDPRYQADCRRGASHLRAVLKSFGAQTVMVAAAKPEWNPIILARFKANTPTQGRPKRILFYGHYDVIPAENKQGKWRTDPFVMEGIDDYLYGRGTSDNKGPIIAAIYAVGDLLAEKSLENDIIFLIEGEEECGSRGFQQAVRETKELIGEIDWILLANSYWLDDHTPCLTYGLRGVIHATIEVRSDHPDLHSGVDGSSLLDESLKDLVMLLATLTGKNGRVEMPGFYDPILPLSHEEERFYTDITTALTQRNPDLGSPRELATTLQRRWREASLTIHRFHTSGPDNSTIIPRLARVAISFRLVPNQEAEQVATFLVDYLHERFATLGSKNTLNVTIDHKAEPWLGDYNNEIFRTLERAVVKAWSTPSNLSQDQQQPPIKLPTARKKSLPTHTKQRPSTSPSLSPTTSSILANGTISPLSEEPPTLLPQQQPPAIKPLYIREGGSIPAIRFLEKEFGAPAAQLPIGQASDHAHLDNERLRLVNLLRGREVFRMVFGGR